MRLTDEVALVTGGSAGIGRATAIRLGNEGARLLVHGRDDERTSRVAQAAGGLPIVADLAKAADRSRLADEALHAFGRVDILINNAGVGWTGPFTQMTEEDVLQIVTVDLLAHIELTRALLPSMMEHGHGHICFVGSVAGRTGVAGEAVYAAAKAGIDLFAESLRLEAAGSNVRISLVIPGLVDTAFSEDRQQSQGRQRLDSQPRPRSTTPESIAAAIVHAIATDRAETWVPSWLRSAPVVRAIAPGSYRRLSHRFGGQDRLGDPKCPLGGSS